MMNRFRFSLQRLLDVSGSLARARRADLAAAMARREETAAMAAEARRNLEEARTHLAARRQEGIEPWEWAAFAAYLRRLEENAAALAAELAERDAEVERCRQALLEARRGAKALEALRRRAWQRHRAAVAAEERRLLDEAAAARAVRGRAEAAVPLEQPPA